MAKNMQTEYHFGDIESYPLFALEKDERPLALIELMIQTERRKALTMHEYNERLMARDAESLPKRRKLDLYFVQARKQRQREPLLFGTRLGEGAHDKWQIARELDGRL